MRLRVDGRRLSDAEVTRLLDVLEWRALSELLVSRGFRLLPIRRPIRASRRGRITLRAAWQRRTGDDLETVRMIADMDAEPA